MSIYRSGKTQEENIIHLGENIYQYINDIYDYSKQLTKKLKKLNPNVDKTFNKITDINKKERYLYNMESRLMHLKRELEDYLDIL